MIKVLVIDDEPMQRQGIVRLTPWGDFGAEVIGAAGSGMEPWGCSPASSGCCGVKGCGAHPLPQGV